MRSATKWLATSMLSFSLLLATWAREPRKVEPQCNEKVDLPNAVRLALGKAPDLSLSCRTTPTVIDGDFDGDGRKDYAVLVAQRTSQKRGFMIVFGDGRTVISGAGRLVRYGAALYSDLNFDQWEMYSKSRPVESGDNQKPLKLHSDALQVSYHDSASGLFYWDGKRIRWYQQGD